VVARGTELSRLCTQVHQLLLASLIRYDTRHRTGDQLDGGEQFGRVGGAPLAQQIAQHGSVVQRLLEIGVPHVKNDNTERRPIAHVRPVRRAVKQCQRRGRFLLFEKRAQHPMMGGENDKMINPPLHTDPQLEEILARLPQSHAARRACESGAGAATLIALVRDDLLRTIALLSAPRKASDPHAPGDHA
jgi:hypothetical protein